MIITSTTEPVRYTPEWRKDEAAPPVYVLRAGSVMERAQLEASLSGPHRAGRIWGYELRQAIRDGVATLMADDPELDRLLSLVDHDGEGQQTDTDKALLTQVQNVLAEHWAPYRDLIAQVERRREIAPIEALSRFLVAVENVDADLKRDMLGHVSANTLAALDPLEMMAAGNFAYGLLYGGGQERNFPQPSGSDDTPESSTSAPSKAGGSSARKSGRKIHA